MLHSTKPAMPLLTCHVCHETTDDDSDMQQLVCPTCGAILRDDEPTTPEPVPVIRPIRSHPHG